MWFLVGFRRVLVGFWRLMIGLVIGAVFYVWMFFNYKKEWESVHEYMHDFLGWLVRYPYLADYSQWNTLLNLDDKLAFALFVMAGRIIWMLFESIFISFPYWLVFGKKNNTSAVSQVATAGAAPNLVAATPPPAGASAANGKLSIGAGDLEENADNLERSIDEALDRIKNVEKTG